VHHLSLSLPKPAVLAAAGLACSYAVLQFSRALLARRWPTVEGEIVDARIVESWGLNDRTYLESAVSYRYHVAGQPYSGNRVRLGQLTPNSWIPARNVPYAAAALARRYPRGKQVRVYYNPRRPDHSVLYLTPDFRVWVILAAGLYLAYAAIHGGLWPLAPLPRV